jgi:hypothetical protein
MFILFDYEGLIEKGGGRIIAEDIQELLANQYNCCYTLSGVYTLSARLNIVWISGRSKHPKHSKELVHEWLDKDNFYQHIYLGRYAQIEI